MLEHGLSVRDYTFDLVTWLKDPTHVFKYNWRFPGWFFPYASDLSKNLCSDFTIDTYTRMHDCGKHKVKILTEKGTLSYPNHAQASHETFLTFSDNLEIAELIRRDMDIHTLKTDQVEEFCRDEPEISCTLLLAGLAEIHSNCQLFGGMESDSFKIKFKHLEKKGKYILDLLFGASG